MIGLVRFPPVASRFRPPAPLAGALWMITGSVLFSLLNLLIRSVSAELHPFQVAFFRNLFSLAFMLPWLVSTGMVGLRTARYGLYGTRALTGLCAMLTWFYALSVMPLGEAVALSFTTPLFATLGAALFLGENVRARRWFATAVGFAGVLIIIRPDAQSFHPDAVIALVSAAFAAASALQVKALARTESTSAMVTFMVLFLTPMSLVPALPVWVWPAATTWIWLVVLGGVATLGHLALSRAFHLADASALLPLDYIKLPCSALLGFLAFGEVMDGWSWAGAGVIGFSTLYIAQREATAARRRKTAAASADD
jgi:drug/metabolite transporter (DMT)-like permease